VVAAGAILLFWVIPNHTELADSEWLQPATLPKITSIIMILAGFLHFTFPLGKVEFDWTFSKRVGLFFLIGIAGLYLMSLIGFILAAPILITVVMIIVGERRPLWLISGIILLPASIWFLISFLLNRPLP